MMLQWNDRFQGPSEALPRPFDSTTGLALRCFCNGGKYVKSHLVVDKDSKGLSIYWPKSKEVDFLLGCNHHSRPFVYCTHPAAPALTSCRTNNGCCSVGAMIGEKILMPGLGSRE